MLYQSNINVAIAVILSEKWSLYDLPELKYRKFGKKRVHRIVSRMDFCLPKFFSHHRILMDPKNITNLLNPGDCTDFRPGRGSLRLDEKSSCDGLEFLKMFEKH